EGLPYVGRRECQALCGSGRVRFAADLLQPAAHVVQSGDMQAGGQEEESVAPLPRAKLEQIPNPGGLKALQSGSSRFACALAKEVGTFRVRTFPLTVLGISGHVGACHGRSLTRPSTDRPRGRRCPTAASLRHPTDPGAVCATPADAHYSWIWAIGQSHAVVDDPNPSKPQPPLERQRRQ